MDIDNIQSTNEEKPAPFSSWDPATRTSSLDADKTADIRNADQLYIAQRKETKSDRPKIPATFYEKLSFYRAFSTSPSKTQIVCSHQIEFNRFFWFHIMNVFCKSLPNTYVYMFLSVYVPNQHLFLSKMVPIAYGSNWAFLGAGLINLITYTDVVAILLDYVICGILFKDPWSRCPKPEKHGRKCYIIQDFSTVLQNQTISFQHGRYRLENKEIVDLAPLAYYRSRWEKMLNVYIYFSLIWIVAAIQYRQLFKKYLWKALHITQMILTVIYVINFGHLYMSYHEVELKEVHTTKSEIDNALWDADIDILSESMTAPPVLHVITSRSIEKVQPEYGSSAVVLSNSVYYIFRGMLSIRLKKHCENLLKFPYFCQSLTISLQCLIETIVSEWKWARREIVTVIIIIVGILHKVFTHFRARLLLYIYSVSIATMFEALILYCVYPIGRLVDDITFYYGVRPTTFRILNMQIVPFFYTMKMYGMFKGFFKIIDITNWAARAPYYLIMLYIMSIPFIVGIIYVVIKCVYIDKKSLKSVFKPIPEWGPEDSVLRQLRKQYDSRYYVDSQAPRKLSRYIIQKSSLETYKLDVKYDNYLRRSSPNAEIRTEDEKKRK